MRCLLSLEWVSEWVSTQDAFHTDDNNNNEEGDRESVSHWDDMMWYIHTFARSSHSKQKSDFISQR